MAIIIEDIRIKDKFRPAETDVDWLLASVGEPIDIEIDFRVEETVISQSSNFNDAGWILIRPSNYISGISDNTNLVYADDPNAFQNFFVGDQIRWTDSATIFTITEKISNQAIRLDTVDGVAVDYFFQRGRVMYVSNLFQGVRYYHN